MQTFVINGICFQEDIFIVKFETPPGFNLDP